MNSSSSPGGLEAIEAAYRSLGQLLNVLKPAGPQPVGSRLGRQSGEAVPQRARETTNLLDGR